MAINLDLIELADLTRPADLAKAIVKQIDSLPIPVPIEEIANATGIQDIQLMPVSTFEGALIAKEGSALILINQNSPRYRQRFTIGHELGHYMCPWHLLKARHFECSSQDMRIDVPRGDPRLRLEVEANLFAAEILMPESLFKRDLRRTRDLSLQTIVELADIYGTSKLATGRRAVVLHDDPAALIVAQDGVFLYAFRGKAFPFISLKATQPLPRGSIARRADSTVGSLTQVMPIDGSHWIESEVRRGAKLFEQCLTQASGYQLILLLLDESDCIDDDEKYAEEKSAWNPRFRR
jgi:Zn-dependent peptidase ImmA (M78 family)